MKKYKREWKTVINGGEGRGEGATLTIAVCETTNL